MQNCLYFIKIIFHNFNFFKKKIYNNNSVVLVEFNRLASSVVSYSYLGTILSNKFKANISAYRINAKKSFIKDVLWKILSYLYFMKKKIFKI